MWSVCLPFYMSVVVLCQPSIHVFIHSFIIFFVCFCSNNNNRPAFKNFFSFFQFCCLLFCFLEYDTASQPANIQFHWYVCQVCMSVYVFLPADCLCMPVYLFVCLFVCWHFYFWRESTLLLCRHCFGFWIFVYFSTEFVFNFFVACLLFECARVCVCVCFSMQILWIPSLTITRVRTDRKNQVIRQPPLASFSYPFFPCLCLFCHWLFVLAAWNDGKQNKFILFLLLLLLLFSLLWFLKCAALFHFYLFLKYCFEFFFFLLWMSPDR